MKIICFSQSIIIPLPLLFIVYLLLKNMLPLYHSKNSETTLFFSLLLVLFFLVSGLNNAYAYDFSAECTSGQTLYYSVTNSSNHYVRVTAPNSSSSDPWSGFSKPVGSLVIPSVVSNGGVEYQVTEIGSYSFYGCSGLTEVVIPNSVTIVDSYAFYGCTGLSELTIGEGVQYIYRYAFWNCPALSTVHFNATNCTQMYTYTNSNVNPLGYYRGVFNSSDQANGSSAITTLTIGGNVTKIPSYSFMNSPSLTGVVIPNSVTTIDMYSFYGCLGMTSVSIPSSVTTIWHYSFYGCAGLTSVVIPDSVTTVGQYAFCGCTGLSELTIGEGVQAIYNCAFWNCPALSTVHFNAINCTEMYTSNSGTDYNRSVFNASTSNTGSSAIATLTIGGNVTNIPNYAFMKSSSLTGVVIPNTVTTVGQYAFYGCAGLTEVTIGEGVQTIGEKAFWSCPALTTVHFNATNCTQMYTSQSNTSYNRSVFNSNEQNTGSSAIAT
ncbi:MAG: leucine-rich repeat domain-containing protein, partial [Bacteroidales bacterium]|nr:leucine-rich repeat domain-containing protein [Bacteroidales bacterium]